MKATITVGCSASGKSSWATTQLDGNTDIIERDTARRAVLDDKKIKYNNMWEVWNWKWEKLVDEKLENQLAYSSAAGRNVILSDTNLNLDRRGALIDKLEKLGYDISVQVFGQDLSLDVLWKRDIYRQHTVGHQTIARQYDQFRKEFPKYILKDVATKPSAIIFDIDGTLATMYNRGPFDWSKVGQDIHNMTLFYAMKEYYVQGYKIIILSGRDSVCRSETIEWLDTVIYRDVSMVAEVNVQYELFMRSENDQRKDAVIKSELFYAHIDGNYKIEAVFDDRPVMCREWHEFGFKVYCCGNQNIEF